MASVRRMGPALLLMCASGLSASAFGCAKNAAGDAPSQRTPSGEVVSISGSSPAASGAERPLSGAASGQASAAAASGSFEEAEFTLRLEPVGSYIANRPGSAQIVLEPKSGFKCNDKYPYKFKVEQSEGLRFANPVVGPDAMTLSHGKSVMKLEFVPEGTGKRMLTGTFSFSVCTEEKCLVERRQLGLEITVGEA